MTLYFRSINYNTCPQMEESVCARVCARLRVCWCLLADLIYSRCGVCFNLDPPPSCWSLCLILDVKPRLLELELIFALNEHLERTTR